MKTIDSGPSRGRTLLFSSGRNEVLRVEFERVVLPCLSQLCRAAVYIAKKGSPGEKPRSGNLSTGISFF